MTTLCGSLCNLSVIVCDLIVTKTWHCYIFPGAALCCSQFNCDIMLVFSMYILLRPNNNNIPLNMFATGNCHLQYYCSLSLPTIIIIILYFESTPRLLPPPALHYIGRHFNRFLDNDLNQLIHAYV